MSLDSGHEATPLEGEELAQQKKDFIGYKDGLVRLNPGRWLFPPNFIKFANGLFNFKVSRSNISLVSKRSSLANK